MSGYRLRDWIWAPIALAAAILSGLITAPNAAADPVRDAISNYGTTICDRLDTTGGSDGVSNILVSLIEDGYTPGQSLDIVAKSVLAFCDNHIPDVDALVDEYTKPAPGQLA